MTHEQIQTIRDEHGLCHDTNYFSGVCNNCEHEWEYEEEQNLCPNCKSLDCEIECLEADEEADDE